jgi:hypothetical protein
MRAELITRKIFASESRGKRDLMVFNRAEAGTNETLQMRSKFVPFEAGELNPEIL